MIGRPVPANVLACLSCGSPLSQGARFCSSCGATSARACASCGETLLAGEIICRKCGAASVETFAAGPTPPPFGSPTGSSAWTAVVERLRAATLGEFVLDRELGRGGMATVFLAHEIALNRKVAIKLMAPGLLMGEGMVERFRQEAVTVANMSHPNIVTIHTVRQIEDLHFFVMKFVEGRSLEHIIASGIRVPIAVIRSLLFQVGIALAYAHRRGVIHRDIKPANVLLDADGNAVVTDFGIAKVAESSTHTQTGTLVGTPAYMSPEQCYAGQVSWPSDQYSLGIVAYELLTGHPPFSGPSFTVMKAHIEGPVPPIRPVRPDCPAELEAAVLRMLAKDPSERWPSMSHALAALGAKPLAEDDPAREELIALAAPDPAFFSHPTPPPPPSPVPRSRTPAGFARNGPQPAVVVIAPPPATIEVGDRFSLSGSVQRPDGSPVPDAHITWSSADRSVATVDGLSGLVTAVAPGETTITASASEAHGELSLTVAAAAATMVNISLPPEPLYVGESVQMTAVVQNKRGTPLPIAPTWSSSDAHLASISPTGVLTANAPGSVRVSVQAGAATGSVVLWVSPVTVEALRLVAPPSSLVIGESVRLSATALDGRDAPLTDRNIVWSSSDRAVATVSAAGVVTAHGNGPVTITAACDGVSASTAITVVDAPVASVSIAAPPRQILIGNKFRLVATPLDAHGTSLKRPVEWKSSNVSVASISEDGVVTPVAAGEVTIIASSEGMEGAVRFSVGRHTQPNGIRALVHDFGSAGKLAAAGSALARSMRERAGAVATGAAATSRRQAGSTRAAIGRLSRGQRSAVGVVAGLVVVGVLFVLTRGTSDGADRAPRAGDRAVTVATSPGASEVAAPAAVDSVEIGMPTSAISVGDTVPLVATVRGSTGEALDGRAIRWRSSDPAVAPVVETTGVVIAAAPGRAVIFAESEGKEGSVDLNVSARGAEAPAGITAIAVGKPAALRVGDVAPLRLSTTPASARPPEGVSWASSNPRVVAIDAKRGVMRGTGVGVAVVSASLASLRSSATVVVLSSNVGSVTVTSPRSISAGETATFVAHTLDGSGKEIPGKAVTWTSDNASIASVDAQSGVVTARAPGTAIITASAEGISGRTVLLVTSGTGNATAEELVRRQVAAFVAAMRARNSARVEQTLSPAEGAEGQSRANLLKLLAAGRPDFAVGGETASPPQISGTKATEEFSVPMSWRTRFGGTRKVIVRFAADLERAEGGWRITSCRILGAPNLD